MSQDNGLFSEYSNFIQSANDNKDDKDPLVSEYGQLISDAEQSKKISVNVSLTAAKQVNPDDAAKAIDLAKETGLPTDTVERNLPEVQDIVVSNSIKRDIEKSPTLQAWFSSAENAKVSQDDVKQLDDVDKSIADLFSVKNQFKAAAGLIFNQVDAFNQSKKDPSVILDNSFGTAKSLTGAAFQGTLGLSEMLFRAPDAAARQYDALVQAARNLGLPTWALPKTEDLYVPDAVNIRKHANVVAGEIANAQQILTNNFDLFREIAKYNAQGDKALEQLIENGDPTAMVQVVSDPESWGAFIGNAIPSLVAAWASGGSPAFIAGLEAMDYATTAAQYEKSTGQKIDDVEFATGQLIVAGINTWLEKLGLEKIMNARSFLGAVVAFITEGTTEGLQEFIQNIAEAITYNPDASLTQGVLPAFLGGAGSGGGAATARITANKVLYDQAKADAEQRVKKLQDLQKKVLESNTFKRHKATFEKFVDTALQGTEDANIYLDAKQATAYFQQVEGVNPSTVFEDIGVTKEELDNALEVGGDIKIPLSKFVKLADTPYYEPLLQDVRLSPGESTFREAVTAQKEQVDSVKEQAQQILEKAQESAQIRESAKKVKDLVKKQLIENVGMPPEIADTNAAIHEAFAVVLGDKLGVDPYDAYVNEALGLRIQSAKTFEELKAKQAEGAILDQEAYHGSRVRGIPRMSTDYVGTGEGGMAFGWGLYFTDLDAIAESYRQQLTGDVLEENSPMLVSGIPAEAITADLSLTFPEAAKVVRQAIASALNAGNGRPTLWSSVVAELRGTLDELRASEGITMSMLQPYSTAWNWARRRDLTALVEQDPDARKGAVYKVELAPEPDEFLLWDRPLSEQSDKVKEAIAPLIEVAGVDWNSLGSEFYLGLNNPQFVGEKDAYRKSGQKIVSLKLRKAGVRGNKYVVGDYRLSVLKGEKPYEEATFNYVVFDDTDIDIIEFYQGEKRKAAKRHLGMWSAVEQAVIDMNLPGWRPKKGKALTDDEQAKYDELRKEDIMGGIKDEDRLKEFNKLKAKINANISRENGQQIWNKLNSMQGVKKEELKWLGIEQWLTAEEGSKFSRDEVLQFVQNNGFQLDVVVADKDESEAEAPSMEFGEGQVVDGIDQYQNIIDDALYELEQASSISDISDASYPLMQAADDLFTKEYIKEFADEYIQAMDDSQAKDVSDSVDKAIDKADDNISADGNISVMDAVVRIISDNGYPEAVDELKTKLEDELSPGIEKYAREQYLEDPVYEYYDPVTDYIIVGNDELGYSLSVDNGRSYNFLDVYSFPEAEIRAIELANNYGDLPDGTNSPEVAKWNDYIMGESWADANSYWETKIIAPSLRPPFKYDTHFPDENILLFRRESSRDLAYDPLITIDGEEIPGELMNLLADKYNEINAETTKQLDIEYKHQPPDDFKARGYTYGEEKKRVEEGFYISQEPAIKRIAEMESIWHEGLSNNHVIWYIENKYKVIKKYIESKLPKEVPSDFMNYGNDKHGFEEKTRFVTKWLRNTFDSDFAEKVSAMVESGDYAKAMKIIVNESDADHVELGTITVHIENLIEFKSRLDYIESQWAVGADSAMVLMYASENVDIGVQVEMINDEDAMGTQFIEELQSDLHQQGSKYGYITPEQNVVTSPPTYATNAVDGMVEAIVKMSESDKALVGDEYKDAYRDIVYAYSFADLYDSKNDATIEYYTDLVDSAPITESGTKHLSSIVGKTIYSYFIDPPKESRQRINLFMPRLIKAINKLPESKELVAAIENAQREYKAYKAVSPMAPFMKKEAWVELGIKTALIDAVKSGKEYLAWSDSDALVSRWGERFRESYTNEYDRLIPKIIKKLIKQDAKRIVTEYNGESYWIVKIPDGVAKEIKDDSFALFQRKRQNGREIRGMIQFPEGSEVAISLFTENMDLSSFLHESGHFFLQTYARLADKSEEIKKDLDILLDWFGVSTVDEIGVDQHEQFAKGFEQYLMEGKAPSKGLQKIFDTFRSWLIRVYESVMSNYFSDVNLTDEVRAVMGRMLAVDDAIENAETDASVLSLLTEQEKLFSDAEKKAYIEKLLSAKTRSMEEASKEIMERVKREASKAWKEERDQLAEQIEADLYSEPVYQARHFLMRGTLPNGEVPEGLTPVKLSKQALVDMYGDGPDALWRRLPFGKYSVWTTKDDGVHPDEIAVMFGFSDGGAMVRAMVEAKGDIKKIAKEKADEAMRQKYGDPDSADAIAELALKSIQNDDRADALFMELRALGRKAKKAVPPRNVIKNAAKRIVSSVHIGDLTPNKYLVQSNKYGRIAYDKAVKGKYGEAADAKQKQLLNMEIYRLALKMKQDAEKKVKYIQKYNRPGTRKNIAKPNLDQIDNILEAYDFKRAVSMKAVRERQALREWIQEQRKKGLEVAFPEDIIEQAAKRSWKELTYDELVGVYSALRNIEYIGRYEKKIIVANEKRDFDSLVEQLVTTALENNKVKEEKFGSDLTTLDKLDAFQREYFASHVKMEFFAQQLDGDEPNGLWWNTIFRPLAEAEDAELQMQADALKETQRIFSLWSEDEQRQLYKRVLDTEKALGRTIKKAELIAIALNWGNEGNRKALLEGEQWNEVQVKQVLDKYMTENDWRVVQEMWDFIDTFWPQIKALQERLTGVAPEKVEATPFETPFGSMRGGYYPLVYDKDRNAKAFKYEEKRSVEEMFGGNFLRPSTRHGHVEARKGSGGMSVDLSLDVFARHISNVIHDLTHREAVLMVDRVIQDPRTRETIIAVSSRELYRHIRPWLANIASDNRPMDGWVEKVVSRLRRGVTAVNMGFKFTTALVQPFGVTNTIELLGAKWTMVGIKKFYGNPVRAKSAIEEVFAKSVMMRNRTKTFDREVRDAIKSIKGTSHYDNMQRVLYSHIGFMDLSVTIPTWIGAYEKGMSDGMGEKDAIAYADSVVRMSQSAGGPKDLAAIQRGGEINRIFVMFYSFFSVLHNLIRRRLKITARQGLSYRATSEITMSFLYLVVIPAVLTEMALGRGPDDDDDETWLGWAAKLIASYPFMTLVGLRDIANHLQSGYTYKATPVIDAADTIVRSLDSIGVAIDPDQEWDQNDTKNVLMASGYLFSLPARQMYISGEHVYAVLEGEEDFSLYEFLVRNVPEDEK